jgi:dihydropyrimidinase
MSVLIQGGRVITPGYAAIADVYIEDETFSRIGAELNVHASTVIDATGKYVLPGGVDPHTHIESTFLDVKSADDFTSGTVAAAYGGTTTVVEFASRHQENS